MTIYAWLGTSLDSFRRVNDTVELVQLSADLEAYFRTVEVRAETNETVYLNGYQVNWQARLVEPKRVGVHPSGAVNAFELGLYDVDISISRQDRVIGQYQTRLVGYQWRGPNGE